MARARARLNVLTEHLNFTSTSRIRLASAAYSSEYSAEKENLRKALSQRGVYDVCIEAPPKGCEIFYRTLLTPEAVEFISQLHRKFDGEISQVLRMRVARKLELSSTRDLPEFVSRDRGEWCVAPVPKRLQCRHVDLGDVSPANDEHFFSALSTKAQGIQTHRARKPPQPVRGRPRTAVPWAGDSMPGHGHTVWESHNRPSLSVPAQQRSGRSCEKQDSMGYAGIPGPAHNPARRDHHSPPRKDDGNLSEIKKNLREVSQGLLPAREPRLKTDFDDGNCPTWANQLRGLYNVYRAVHGHIKGAPPLQDMPVLMLRPRAWNMVENNMMVAGKAVCGPVFDFALLLFHNAKRLYDAESGPFLYLSKLEGHLEARLWNNIFTWTQKQLGIPVGSIKACVLIENILATFEMDEILYELKDHSAGLNCGVWDYSASICNKFGDRPNSVLPDRKHLHMGQHFLRSYMDLLIQTCHRRGALATGGMAAQVLPDPETAERQKIISDVKRAKAYEIEAGVDGFIVYDFGLISPAQEVFKNLMISDNQIKAKLRREVSVSPEDLLRTPQGGVTLDGLRHNVSIAIVFIYNWLRGVGHFTWKGLVEDSATAEISRSQIWMWIRHGSRLSDGDQSLITRNKIQELISEFMRHCLINDVAAWNEKRLQQAAAILEEIITKQNFPEFITTYLSEDHAFLASQKWPTMI